VVGWLNIVVEREVEIVRHLERLIAREELAFLGAVLTTSILIRARSVVQVHLGPP
jgi:hypothetical protein